MHRLKFYYASAQYVQGSLFKKEQGFSLIEVVVSMGLFSLGLLSIISLQLQAHRAIADSALKNQALAFASSRYEIYYLEHTYHKNTATIVETWQKNIQVFLPEARVESQINSDNTFELKLFWASNQPSVTCKVREPYAQDCLEF